MRHIRQRLWGFESPSGRCWSPPPRMERFLGCLEGLVQKVPYTLFSSATAGSRYLFRKFRLGSISHGGSCLLSVVYLLWTNKICLPEKLKAFSQSLATFTPL